MNARAKAERARKKGFVPGANFGVFTVIEAPALSRIKVRCHCGREAYRAATVLRKPPLSCPHKPRAYEERFAPGTRHGPLVILESSPDSVKVRCDCGREVVLHASTIRRAVRRPIIGCSHGCSVRKAERARRRGYVPGARFGVFTVIEARNLSAIKVRCDCGRESFQPAARLNGPSVFCSTECRNEAATRGWIGRKYGKLTVVARAGVRGWWCQCSCGRTHVADRSNLREGRTRSCGCVLDKINAERQARARKALSDLQAD